VHRRLALGTVAAASALTLLAGCGTASSGGKSSSSGTPNNSSVPPKTELTDAFHSLSAGSALTTTLSLGITSANLIHISGEGGDTPLTQHQADLITSARIVFETTAPQGRTLAQEAAAGANSNAAVSVTGSAGGTTYFTLDVVNKTIYLQVDLKRLFLDTVNDGEPYSNLVAETASMPQFVQDFIAGKFVSLPLATVKSFSSFLEGAIQGSSKGAIPDPAQIKTLVAGLESAVLSDLTVVRTTTGDTDELVITGNARNIGRDILSTVAGSIPAAAAAISPGEADQVPNQDLKLDASVTGGALSKLSFDFGQFSPHQKDTLPIQATFAKTGPTITAPAGATAVNFQDLIAFFTAVGQSSSSSSSGSGSAPAPTTKHSTAAPSG